MAEPDTVSVEAHQREKDKVAALEAENQALKAQTADATLTLSDYMKRDAARVALKDKVADPDAVADLITPFLKDVETDQVAAHVGSDEFKPRLAAFRSPEHSEPPPEPGGFGGPSPAGDSTAQPLDGKQKVRVGTPEYQALLNDPAGMKAAYDEGRVAEPQRP